MTNPVEKLKKKCIVCGKIVSGFFHGKMLCKKHYRIYKTGEMK